MRHSMRMNRFRRTSLLASCVLLAGGVGASVAAGTAQAAACGPAVQAGTACTLQATLTLI